MKIKSILNKKIYKMLLVVIISIILIAIFNLYYFNKNGLELLQISNNDIKDDYQMMGYIIKSKNNKIIVIDGGTRKESNKILDYLKKNGGKVDAWFITHPHKDHMGAFCEIVENYETSGISIENVYVTLNQLEDINKYEPTRYEEAKEFYNNLENKALENKVKEVNLNEVFNFDNIKIEVLGIKNPEITKNYGNNSSMVLKFSVLNKKILFLADTGIESGNKLLSKDIKSDYVQLSHHGQNGVDENVYKKIDANYYLWPTANFLWENKKGNYKTDETKEWINKLNVNKSYIAKDGDILIKIN